MEKKQVYTLTEVTEILQVTRRTLYNYIKAGKLEGVKIGRDWRITQEALEKSLLIKGDK